MRKLLSLSLACAMSLALFAGCGATEEKTTTESTAEATTESSEATTGSKPLNIGYAINNLNDTFQTFVLDAAEAKILEAGHKMSVSDASEDVIKQQDNVAAFIEQGVDGLIVVPVDTSAMDPITQMAQDAGIPIVYVNRNPYFGKEDQIPENVYYSGSESVISGQIQAEYVGELLGGEGGIAILQGILGNEATSERTRGVEETMAEMYPNIEVLAAETGNWQRDQGMTVTENWITKYGNDLNAVLANNDEMAIGAINALTAAGRDDVLVMGIDAIDDALSLVETGEMVGTVLQDSVGQGAGAAETLIASINGENPESFNWIPYVLVTKDNLSDFK